MWYATVGGILFVMFGIGSSYITCALAVAYPAFKSFIALESEGLDDDKQWLTYWVVFGLFNILDHFAGFILMFIPFYYFLKLCFLVWLANFNGAQVVYDKFVSPTMNKYKVHIEEIENKIKSTAGELKDSAQNMTGMGKKDE